jgi:hypothetical protein
MGAMLARTARPRLEETRPQPAKKASRRAVAVNWRASSLPLPVERHLHPAPGRGAHAAQHLLQAHHARQPLGREAHLLVEHALDVTGGDAGARRQRVDAGAAPAAHERAGQPAAAVARRQPRPQETGGGAHEITHAARRRRPLA